jgi:hypothetical protein
MADAPSRLTTPDRETECTLVELFESYETVDAYLKEKRAPESIRAELDAMVELVQRVVMTPPIPSHIEEAIKTLQHAVQKLTDRIEASDKAPDGPRASYAAVAAAGASKRPVMIPTLQHRYKHIPTRHKREIIVVRGTETVQQKNRTYKELIEQLNASGTGTGSGARTGTGEAVAIRRLPSGDMVVTMADEKARTSWLADQKWAATLGAGAWVKMREFAVIAHGIQVNQVQGSPDERIE